MVDYHATLKKTLSITPSAIVTFTSGKDVCSPVAPHYLGWRWTGGTGEAAPPFLEEDSSSGRWKVFASMQGLSSNCYSVALHELLRGALGGSDH